MTFTDNELKILRSSRDNGGLEQSAFVQGVINSSGLNPRKARGVLGSLVKIGAIVISLR
jgi:hypothetical protein